MNHYHANFDVSDHEYHGFAVSFKLRALFALDWIDVYFGADREDNFQICARAKSHNVVISARSRHAELPESWNSPHWVHVIDNVNGLLGDVTDYSKVSYDRFSAHHGIDHADEAFLCVTDGEQTFMFRVPGNGAPAWAPRASTVVKEGWSEPEEEEEAVTGGTQCGTGDPGLDNLLEQIAAKEEAGAVSAAEPKVRGGDEPTWTENPGPGGAAHDCPPRML